MLSLQGGRVGSDKDQGDERLGRVDDLAPHRSRHVHRDGARQQASDVLGRGGRVPLGESFLLRPTASGMLTSCAVCRPRLIRRSQNGWRRSHLRRCCRSLRAPTQRRRSRPFWSLVRGHRITTVGTRRPQWGKTLSIGRLPVF